MDTKKGIETGRVDLSNRGSGYFCLQSWCLRITSILYLDLHSIIIEKLPTIIMAVGLTFNLQQFRKPVQQELELHTKKWFTNQLMWLTPNRLSFSNLFFSTLAGIVLAFYSHRTGIILLLLGMAFVADTFDGIVARSREIASPRGLFIDSSFDRLGEAAFLVGLFFSRIFPDWAVLSVAITAFLGNYLRSAITSLGGRSHPSIWEKGERNIVFVMVLLALSIPNLNGIALSLIHFMVCMGVLATIQLVVRGIYQLSNLPPDPDTTTYEEDFSYNEEFHAT